MRVLWLGLLMFVLCLGCNSAEEARRKAVENNLKQIGEAIKNYEQNHDTLTSEFTHVIATETEYYSNGPQQSRPPDGKFSTGTRVSIVEEAGSYVRVRSEGGVEAYVATDSVNLL